MFAFFPFFVILVEEKIRKICGSEKVRGTFSAWAKKFESEESPGDFFSLSQETRKLLSLIGFFNVNLVFTLPKRY